MSDQPKATACLVAFSQGQSKVIVEIVDGKVFIEIENDEEQAMAYLSAKTAREIAAFILQQVGIP